jgi:hypothetical protein
VGPPDRLSLGGEGVPDQGLGPCSGPGPIEIALRSCLMHCSALGWLGAGGPVGWAGKRPDQAEGFADLARFSSENDNAS